MSTYKLSDSVQAQLAGAIVEKRDLLDSIRNEELAEDPFRPGRYTCRCTVAVRRPLDLETAELRRLRVEARRLADGWEIVAVRGLPVPADL